MPYIEWKDDDIKIRKNVSLDASVFMSAWKIIKEKDSTFSGLVNDLIREWVEMKNEDIANGLSA